MKKRPTLFELHFPGKKLKDLMMSSVIVDTQASAGKTSDIPKLVDFIDGYLILAIDQ